MQFFSSDDIPDQLVTGFHNYQLRDVDMTLISFLNRVYTSVILGFLNSLIYKGSSNPLVISRSKSNLER